MNAPVTRDGTAVMLDDGIGWTRIARDGVVLHVKGYEQTRSAEDLAGEAAGLAPKEAAIQAWLAGLDGFFALVIEAPSFTLAAADRVASMPLLWAARDARMWLTQSGPQMETALGLTPAGVDPVSAASIAQSGYTSGDDTLYREVKRLTPGQYVLWQGGLATIGRYHLWDPWRPDDVAPENLVRPLSHLHTRLIEKLVSSAGGRSIFVPLSAGLDSRMILSGLVEAGYGQVRAFTYGIPGNREAVVSRDIAARLGVPWTFVPYDAKTQRSAMASPRHQAYEAYADSLTGIHFPQDYLAISRLLETGEMDGDAIVVNGQTGDFISGNHVLPPLTEPAGDAAPEVRWERILSTSLRKHFKMWRSLETPEAQAPIKDRLREDMEALGGLPESPLGDHGLYEYSEFVNRQSKYVIHGQRCYEFLGLDWRLPLWDREYLDFWARAPLAAKRHQSPIPAGPRSR